MYLSFLTGVGGIETEAVMLGLPVTLTLPEVVGCELTGSSNAFVTSIDIVLGITKVSSNISCYMNEAAPQESRFEFMLLSLVLKLLAIS